MNCAEKRQMIVPILVLAFFISASFLWIFYFHNYQLKRIIETTRLLNVISGDIRELNRTVQSGILTLDDKYAVQSAGYSLKVFAGLARLEETYPDKARIIEALHMDYYVKLVSIGSLFIEKRLDEGRRRLNEIEAGYTKIDYEISRLTAAHSNEYRTAVRNINIFMASAAIVFVVMVISIIKLFFYYAKKRREADLALVEAKAYTDNIILSMADILMVINPDATIHTVNHALCEMLGYPEDELTGASLEMVLAEEVFINGALLKTLLTLMEDGSIRDHQVVFKTKGGEKIPVSIHASVMFTGNGEQRRSNGIIWVARDLREVMELQKQLVHSEKMASLGTMATGVAHEIKNPLAIIHQGVEYLKPSLSADPLLLDVASQIKDAVLRADRIVKGLMVFSRQTSFRFEDTELTLFIEDTLMLVEGQLKMKHVGVVRQFSQGLPLIKADSTQMMQVFLNVIENALEAMPDGGTITVSLKKPSANFVIVSFVDTGQGIPEIKVLKVFEPFFTTKSKNAHAGLGLSIAKGIVDGHGGSLSVESEEGKGTRVTIALPVKQKEITDD